MYFVIFVVCIILLKFVICCDSFPELKYLINFVYNFLIVIFILFLKYGTKNCVTFRPQKPTSAPMLVCIN